MFKTFKNSAIVFASLVVTLTICESATAQLRVNERDSIPRGQEREFLEFQRNNPNARQIRVMPDCFLGEGLGCNKTGTILEKFINQYRGTTYQDILMRATGGENNFRKFAEFYGNNPHLPNIPYSSFWRDENSSIVDSYHNVLGGRVGRNPVSGLRNVTNNFAWSPASRATEISERDGLLNLKYAYGRVLFEEAAKIPNLQERIRSLNLPPEITKFYLDNISEGIRHLKSGNENQLKQSILKVLSFPYTPGAPNVGLFGRQPVDLPDVSQVVLTEGDSLFTGLPPLGGEEIMNALIPPGLGETIVPQVTTPPWLFSLMPLAVLFFLLRGDGSSGPSERPVEPPPETSIPPSPPETSIPPSPPPDLKTVPEPSAIPALLLLTLALGKLNYKQKLVPQRGSHK